MLQWYNINALAYIYIYIYFYVSVYKCIHTYTYISAVETLIIIYEFTTVANNRSTRSRKLRGKSDVPVSRAAAPKLLENYWLLLFSPSYTACPRSPRGSMSFLYTIYMTLLCRKWCSHNKFVPFAIHEYIHLNTSHTYSLYIYKCIYYINIYRWGLTRGVKRPSYCFRLSISTYQ